MQPTVHSLVANRTFLRLLAVAFFMHVASYLIIPTFPIYLEKVRGFSVSQAGIVLGAGSIAYQIGSLLGGLLSDRYGRRDVLMTGTLIQACAMAGYSVSRLYAAFLLFAVINGIGLGLLAPTLKAMIARTVNEEQRTTAFSWRGIAANVGIILAGLAITVFALVADRRVFLYAAAVYLMLALFTRLRVPQDRCVGENCRPIPLSEYRQILGHRSFLLFSAVTLLIWGLYAQFSLMMPLRGEYVLGSAASIGLIWTINSLVVVFFQGPISRLVLERLNPYLSLVAGTLMLGLGLFSLGWATHFVTLSASALLFTTGEMLFLPVLDSLVGHFAKAEWLGAYFGIANVVSGIGSAIGTSVGGSLVERLGGVGSRLPWIAYGLVTLVFAGLLGLFAVYAMSRHRRGRTEPMTLRRKEKAR